MDKGNPQKTNINQYIYNSDNIKPKVSTTYKELCPSKDS